LKRFGNITLKRGVTNSLELYQWHHNLLDGVVDRRNGTVILLNDAREQVVRWNFREGLPQKYEGPRLNAKSGEVAIETFVISCERMEREPQ
jgi:phage tail-like protein